MPIPSLPKQMNESNKEQSKPALKRPVKNVFFGSRLMVIIAIAVMQLVALLGALGISYFNNFKITHLNSEHYIEKLVETTAYDLKGFLEIGTNITKLLEIQLNALEVGSLDQSTLFRAMRNTLSAVPGVHGAMIGKSDGSFVFIRRHGKDQSQRFVRIVSPNRMQQTDFIIPNDSRGFRYLKDIEKYKYAQTTNKDVIFNIKTRPWYISAFHTSNQLHWTDHYMFQSSQKPGITVSTPLKPYKGITPVLAIDIEILELKKYLDSIVNVSDGVAFLINKKDEVITSSHPNWKVDKIIKLDGLKDPVLKEIQQQSTLINKPKRHKQKKSKESRTISVNGTSYFTYLQKVILQPNLPWIVGVYIPTHQISKSLPKTTNTEMRTIMTISVIVVIVLGSCLTWGLIFIALRLLSDVEKQATTDSLTGLLNRESITSELNIRINNPLKEVLGVVVFDLDGFKQVNDSLGHDAGDQVLKEMGQRLKQYIQPDESIGRLGGDEFALIIKGTSQLEITQRIHEILNSVIQSPIYSDEHHQHQLGATAGLSFLQPQQDTTEEKIIQQADLALIRGKQIQKGLVWIDGQNDPYDPSTD